MNEWNGHLAGMASEEMDDPRQIPQAYPRGKYLLVFDPLAVCLVFCLNLAIHLREKHGDEEVEAEDTDNEPAVSPQADPRFKKVS